MPEAIERIIERLKARDPLPPLFPTAIWDEDLSEQIRALRAADKVADAAVRAGLFLWNDDLDASHTLSQNIATPTGSFWHAIMHRREGDAGNAKYWWRRTGKHPAFDPVHLAALAALQHETEAAARAFDDELRQAGTWLPERFVDLCVAGRRGGAEWLPRVQVAEIETLLDWCLERS